MSHVDSAVQFTIAVLFNGVWQAPIFALAAWLVLRIRSNINATTRHSVFAAALLAGVIVPVMTSAVTIKHVSDVVRGTSETQVPPHTVPYKPIKSGASTALFTQDAGPAVTPILSIASVARLNLSLPRAIALTIVSIWLIGAAVFLSRLVLGLLHLERLKRNALPLAVDYRAQLPRWLAVTQGSHRVRLCRSREIVIPLAVGLGDAMVLLPDQFLEEFEPCDIDAIVLHELAHLRRGDDWLNALERVAAGLLFFNPAVLWLVSQLNLEREVACDDWVLQKNEALPYATCLTKVVETTLWPHRAVTTPGAFVTRRGMSIRIERLLARRRDIRVHTAVGPAGATVALLTMLGIAAIFVAPSIAYAVVAKSAANAPAGALQAPQTPVSLARKAIKPVLSPTPAIDPQPASSPFPLVVSSRLSPIAIAAADNEQIIAAANAPDYVDELASAGYVNLTVDELVQMKAVGVTGAFILELRREGFSHPRVRDLVTLRALGVDAAFIRTMRRHYGASIRIDDIAAMRAVGATTEYADELSAIGLPNLSAEQIRSLRALDVTPAYIRDLARAGYTNLDFGQIEQLKALGIDAAYVSRAAAHGFHHLPIEQLVRLKAIGVL